MNKPQTKPFLYSFQFSVYDEYGNIVEFGRERYEDVRANLVCQDRQEGIRYIQDFYKKNGYDIRIFDSHNKGQIDNLTTHCLSYFLTLNNVEPPKETK